MALNLEARWLKIDPNTRAVVDGAVTPAFLEILAKEGFKAITYDKIAEKVFYMLGAGECDAAHFALANEGKLEFCQYERRIEPNAAAELGYMIGLVKRSSGTEMKKRGHDAWQAEMDILRGKNHEYSTSLVWVDSQENQRDHARRQKLLVALEKAHGMYDKIMGLGKQYDAPLELQVNSIAPQFQARDMNIVVTYALKR